MWWFDEIAERVTGPQVVNDSKTPSGSPHVGSLRGVLIHDAIHRALVAHGVPSEYRYGFDDLDPLDGLPGGALGEFYAPHMGKPLSQAPPPPGSDADSMGSHYMKEFQASIRASGAEPVYYRTSELYKAGTFDAAIDRILSNAAVVREVYERVSGAKRPDDWLPFQVICENCGRIGTTVVTKYSNGEVDYFCSPNAVKWAKGCGNRGRVAPFGGRGKLPWKLEWVAKWVTFGVSIEGAGKDHSTKGGSRDVAEACLAGIYDGRKGPLNVPYEFFLVAGAKMSSSKGVGASARDVVRIFPQDVLRYLMLGSEPRSTVSITVDERQMMKVFNETDRLRSSETDRDRELLAMCDLRRRGAFYAVPWHVALAYVQLPHVNAAEDAAKRKGAPLDAVELAEMNDRIACARFWLDTYAPPEARFAVQDEVPPALATLSEPQRAFLAHLAPALETCAWGDDEIQTVVFDTARLTPLSQGDAFKAIYAAFLGGSAGPRAGSLLYFLGRDFALRRLRAATYDPRAFLSQTAVGEAELAKWRGSGTILRVVPRRRVLVLGGAAVEEAEVFVDLAGVRKDGRIEVLRVRVAADIAMGTEHHVAAARHVDAWIRVLPTDGAPIEQPEESFSSVEVVRA
jgi:lysyl-tRNA synthetase class 1